MTDSFYGIKPGEGPGVLVDAEGVFRKTETGDQAVAERVFDMVELLAVSTNSIPTPSIRPCGSSTPAPQPRSGTEAVSNCRRPRPTATGAAAP